jgi:hypothetical protein
MLKVFESNTFKGLKIFTILKRFEQRVGKDCKPVIVAYGTMLLGNNVQKLIEQGYHCIVLNSQVVPRHLSIKLILSYHAQKKPQHFLNRCSKKAG